MEFLFLRNELSMSRFCYEIWLINLISFFSFFFLLFCHFDIALYRIDFMRGAIIRSSRFRQSCSFVPLKSRVEFVTRRICK